MKSGQTSLLYFVYFSPNAIHMVLMTHPLSDELMAGTEDLVGRLEEEQTEVVEERRETSSSVV